MGVLMLTAVTARSEPEFAPECHAPESRRLDVEHRARELLSRHGYFRGRSNVIELVQQHDVLVVRGSVPSFYLKQMLQTVLRELDGVCRVDNRVDVVACDGLSSVREQ
jgi:hypothetical protein